MAAPAAHRRWHFTRGEAPTRYVLWYVRSKDAPPTETAGNLFRSFWAFITGTETAWVLEAREAAAAEATTAGEKGETRVAKEHEEEGSYESDSATSSVRGAKELSAEKRQVMVLGLLATATCWALFVWFIFTCACLQPARAVRRSSRIAALRRRHAYLPADGRRRGAVVRAVVGRLVRHQRGCGGTAAVTCLKHACVCSHDSADHACSLQWKDVAQEAVKAAVILVVLERLFLSPNTFWLEARACAAQLGVPSGVARADNAGTAHVLHPKDHVDYISLQALLLKRQGLGIVGQVRILWQHTKRLSNE